MNAYYRSCFMLLATACSNCHCVVANILATTTDLARPKTASLSLYHTLFYSTPFADRKSCGVLEWLKFLNHGH